MYGETGSPEVCSSNLTIQMCSYKIDLSARQGEQTSRFMQVSRACVGCDACYTNSNITSTARAPGRHRARTGGGGRERRDEANKF